jgi:hypothetical protein
MKEFGLSALPYNLMAAVLRTVEITLTLEALTLSSTFFTARVSGSHFLNIQLVRIPMPIVSMRKQDTWMQ